MVDHYIEMLKWPVAAVVISIGAIFILRVPIRQLAVGVVSAPRRIRDAWRTGKEERQKRKEERQARNRKNDDRRAKALFWYVGVTMAANLLVISAMLTKRDDIVQILPLVWFFGIVSFVASLSVFAAYFHDDISNLTAWGAILVNGCLTIGVFSAIHAGLGIYDGGDPPTITHDPWTGLYFSIVTFTTLGYGDFQPTHDLRLIAGTEALLGYVFLGLMVGIVIHHATGHADPARHGGPGGNENGNDGETTTSAPSGEGNKRATEQK